MQTFGLRRAMKVYASQVRRQARRERRHDKIRRIGRMLERGEALMRAVQPNHVNPISVEALEALMSTEQTTTKERPA